MPNTAHKCDSTYVPSENNGVSEYTVDPFRLVETEMTSEVIIFSAITHLEENVSCCIISMELHLLIEHHIMIVIKH